MSEKILIVDDDRELLRLIAFPLHRAGYETVGATDGSQALEKVRTEKPDLMILDIMLPGLDGIEVCKRLRGHPETVTLPIIMLSALTAVDDKIKGLEAGADEYLTKPISPKEVVARVRALLERTGRLRQVQPREGGKVLGFIGATGGVGTTTTTLNVAIALTQEEESVVAVELQPYYGSFSVHLGQAPQETLHDLLALDARQINERTLRMHLVHDASGLQILYGPYETTGYQEATAEQVGTVIEGLAPLADYVLLDLPSIPSPATETALRFCEHVILLLKPEPASIAAGRAMLGTLRSWGIGLGVVEAVIVNHAPLAVGVNATDIAEQLGCEVVGIIPPSADAVVAAQKQGRPLIVTQPQNPANARFVELASRLRSLS